MATKDEKVPQVSTEKPLAEKSDAELKRETKARLRHLDPMTATQLVNEVVGKQAVGGFVDFLRENAVVGLAVGFVVGMQVQGVVKQLIASFIDPLTQLFGGKSLSERTIGWYVHGQSQQPVVFAWGAFVFVLIDFLTVLVIIYAIIKLLKLDKLDKK